MELKTPLYDVHVRSGGKIVEFGGFLMPVQYGAGIKKEHMAVRTACGLFDVSHMGEVVLKGPDALKNLNHILTNDYSGMADGQARYSPVCNEKGGVVDDVIVYKVSDEEYLIVVNAANRSKDYQWFLDHKTGDAEFIDVSDDYIQLALQGPKAKDILLKLTDPSNIPEKYYTCIFDGDIRGMKCIISQTGYTGEDGYEIYSAPENAEKLWDLMMEAGEEFGILPCGLGARDTLRLEAAMPLYGHEMNDDISPRETGLGMFVKMDKPEFVGKEALEAKGEPKIKRIGIKAVGRGIIREHCDIYDGEVKIGTTSSGTFCPFFGESLAMGLVDRERAEVGRSIQVDIRGKRVDAEIVKTPFYKKPSKR